MVPARSMSETDELGAYSDMLVPTTAPDHGPGGGSIEERSNQGDPRRRGSYGPTGRADRSRITTPIAFRRGARGLHVRDAVRDVRHRVPLHDVATTSSDGRVLATWLAIVFSAPSLAAQPAGVDAPTLRCFRAEQLYLAPQCGTRSRSLADHVGLRHRGIDHVSPGFRLDSFRADRRRPGSLPRDGVRISDDVLSHRFTPRHGHHARAGLVVIPRDCRRHAGDAPPHARS